jgi:hypothetical protein
VSWDRVARSTNPGNVCVARGHFPGCLPRVGALDCFTVAGIFGAPGLCLEGCGLPRLGTMAIGALVVALGSKAIAGP